jgi:Co/Zn/Cd efflux system component
MSSVSANHHEYGHEHEVQHHSSPYFFILPLCFIACSIVNIRLTWPLAKHCGMILLQSTPPAIRAGLERCIREISFYDGVLECKNLKLWMNDQGK